MDSVVAVPHKTNATFNDWDMRGCWMENDGDVVVLHVVHERFKFGINVKMGDVKSGGVAQSEGLIKTFAQGWDGAVIDVTNSAKFEVLRDC